MLINGLSLLNSEKKPPEWRPFTWRGLQFPNRLGIAGGVDKDARNVEAWWSLGSGFVEVGTITPRPQSGNPPPVVDRDVSHRAIWNRLGFPSQGLEAAEKRLRQLKRPFPAPLFANVGKNATTPLAEAHKDYALLLERLKPWVDGFVINISSPNTKGLRDLLEPDRLREFLHSSLASLKGDRPPILLKLSPDMKDDETARVLDLSIEAGIDGWIISNTSQSIREGLPFPDEGGVSGSPLAARSKQLLQHVIQLLGPRKKDRLLISVGGVLSAADVQERLDMGADLVQCYAALIFEGPRFFRQVAKCQQQNLKH